MKYITVLVVALFAILSINAQVGILTTTPRATLEVASDPTNMNIADGIKVPALTRNQLNLKNDAYGADQISALLYVRTLDGAAIGKTVNVTKVGHYYFDGVLWQPFDYISNRIFYLPPFELPVSAVANARTFELHPIIQRFGAGNTLYRSSTGVLQSLPISALVATDFDYYVIYYDSDVINITNLSNTGRITYNVLRAHSGTDSFINVVVVVK